MTAATIAEHLHGRKSGPDYIALCPAHNDKNPSLSIKDADGKVLIHCFAGCDSAVVVEKLKDLGLWPEREQTRVERRSIVATYDYTDPHGNLLYQVVRFQPKGFLPRYPDGRGDWIWKKHPTQTLYHLPEVLEAAIVFCVEGEKDADRLREHGFVATTVAGGCKAPWLPQFSEALRGREVVIVPDNDAPGWQRAAEIARALLGVAARIVVLDLPDAVKDISDWFDAGHSELELIAMLDRVPHAV